MNFENFVQWTTFRIAIAFGVSMYELRGGIGPERQLAAGTQR